MGIKRAGIAYRKFPARAGEFIRTDRMLGNRPLYAHNGNHSIEGVKLPNGILAVHGGGQPLKKFKILLAEDDFFFTEVLKETFERSCPGCEILEAMDGLAALDLAKKIPSGSLNIGFIDTRMAGKNGFDVCKELRTMHPSVYLILKSGNVSERHQIFKDEKIIDAVFDTENLSLNLDPLIDEAIKTASERSSAADNNSPAAPKPENA